MIKRLLLSLLIITGVSSSAFVATKALLETNGVTLAANSFDTGSLSLQITKDGDTTWHNDSVTGFTGQLKPGETKSYYVWLKNSTADVTLRIASQVPTPTVTGGVTAGDISLVFTPVDASGTPTGSSTTSHSLTTFANPQSFQSSLNLPPTVEQRYKMDVKMGSSVDTQGSVNFSVIFTGTQVTPTPSATPTP
jgi:hypothetical protein